MIRIIVTGYYDLRSNVESPCSKPRVLLPFHNYYSPDENPKLKDAFGDVLPLAADWKTIGCLLGIDRTDLNKIQSNEDRVNDHLQEMLAKWLTQVDPPPTWAALADAVEPIDKSIAQRVRQRTAS